MSASHNVFAIGAVKMRPTRSSWTGGPVLPFLPRFFLPNALHHRLVEQIRQAVRSAIGCPASRGFLDEVAVAELRIIAVGVEQGVGPLRLQIFGVSDRVSQPAVVGLAGELEYPARHRHGDSVGGELFHERVESFPGRLA